MVFVVMNGKISKVPYTRKTMHANKLPNDIKTFYNIIREPLEKR